MGHDLEKALWEFLVPGSRHEAREDPAFTPRAGVPIAIKKKALPQGEGFLFGSLAVSYFRTVYLALSSALRRFTVLFGMG
ncbi:MAG: hypothetical protein AMJ66_09880, partial [Betaproteobacteria bacterium SG8_40]